MSMRNPKVGRDFTMVSIFALIAQCIPAQEPAQPPSAAADERVHNLVFFGDTRPVLLRMHVNVEGTSPQAAFRAGLDDFIHKLFAFLDRNNDGTLDSNEMEGAPAPQALLNNMFAGVGANTASFRAIDKGAGGKVTLAELKDYYRTNPDPAFQFQFVQGQPAFAPSDEAISRQAPTASSLAMAIFNRVDTNLDGKLSKDEFAMAATILNKLDTDDDEIVSHMEVMGVESASPFAPNRVASPMAIAVIPGNSPFLPITDQAVSPMVQQLLTRYGKPGANADESVGARTLSRSEIGLETDIFDLLDSDKNSVLDGSELARFHLRSADLELLVRFGKMANGEKALEFSGTGGPTPLAPLLNRSANGELATTIGNSRIRLIHSGNAIPFGPGTIQAYVAQFKAADTDMNGYLDEKEAERSQFRGSFKMIDRDSDGKIFEKEVLDYVEKIVAPQTQAASNRIVLTIEEQSRGLFDLLDKNHDGVLGSRERATATQFPGEWDRNGDWQISADEIPRNFQLLFSRGQANTGQMPGNFVFAPFAAPGRPPMAAPTGPLWFRKMDRNHDGDVSRREFLGTRADFDRIDTDGDGLIDAPEAMRVTQPSP